MSALFRIAALMPLLCAAIPSLAQPTAVITDPRTGRTSEVVAGEVLVKFKPNVSQSKKTSLFQTLSATPLTAGPSAINIERIRIAEGQSVADAVRDFSGREEVLYAQPNYTYNAPSFTPQSGIKAAVSTNDTFFGLQQTPLNLIEVPDAWSITTGDSSVLIALIGTGIHHDHPDLGGGRGAGYKVVEGYDFLDRHNNPVDANGETTRSASIIGAAANNAAGLAGIMWNVRFLDLKVYHSSDKRGNSATVAEAIDYAIQRSANIIQVDVIQETSAEDRVTLEAVDKAYEHGIPIVGIAGTGGSRLFFPCSYESVICVGSLETTNVPAAAANGGKELDVAAPYYAVVATTGNAYSAGTASNHAASYVTGIMGLMHSVRPRLSGKTVQDILTSTADDVWDVGVDSVTGRGRVNALKALQKTQSTYDREAQEDTVPMPNPFLIGNVPFVTFSIPNGLSNSDLSVKIYDVSGLKIREITGTNTWDGRNNDGRIVASGLYFYNLQTAGGSARGRVTLIR